MYEGQMYDVRRNEGTKNNAENSDDIGAGGSRL